MNGFQEARTLESVPSVKVRTGTDQGKYTINRPPCRKCGNTTRNADGKCPDCSKRKAAAYYKKNREKLYKQRKVHAESFSNQEKKERNKRYKLNYQEKHPGRIQEQSRARYAKDPEKHKGYCDKYRAANIDKIRARDNEWVRLNPDKVKDYNDAYRAANLEKERARNIAWAKRNPENVYSRCALRRARKLSAETEIFSRMEIFERDKWVCQLCHKKVNKRLKHPDPLSASIDHIIPLSQGGAHTRANTHLAHLICNEKAGVGGVKQLLMFG